MLQRCPTRPVQRKALTPVTAFHLSGSFFAETPRLLDDTATSCPSKTSSGCNQSLLTEGNIGEYPIVPECNHIARSRGVGYFVLCTLCKGVPRSRRILQDVCWDVYILSPSLSSICSERGNRGEDHDAEYTFSTLFYSDLGALLQWQTFRRPGFMFAFAFLPLSICSDPDSSSLIAAPSTIVTLRVFES